MKRLVNYFLQGLIFLVPIALTIYVFVAVFLLIDGWLGLPVPGLGFVFVLLLITGSGFLLSNFLTRRILGAFEGLLDRLPFVKLLHTSVKDLMSAFVGEKRRFDKPCAVDIGGVRVMGFITRESMDSFGLVDTVAVYLPQAYNFAGQLILVPKSSVTAIEIDSAHVMTFIVSGGITRTS